jgi:hypothetical protein
MQNMEMTAKRKEEEDDDDQGLFLRPKLPSHSGHHMVAVTDPIFVAFHMKCICAQLHEYFTVNIKRGPLNC